MNKRGQDPECLAKFYRDWLEKILLRVTCFAATVGGLDTKIVQVFLTIRERKATIHGFL